MNVVNFDKIVSDVISSFSMESLKVPDNVLGGIKNMYVDQKNEKKNLLIKKRRLIRYDFRRK